MTTPPKNNIIFDLDGVIIRTSLSKASWQIGPKIIGSCLLKGSLLSLEQHYFKFLEELKPYNSTTPYALSVRGTRLPCLMIDYQLGFISSQEVINIVHQALTNNHYSKDRTLYTAMTKLIFDPVIFVNCYKPVKSMINILKRCKAAAHKDGSPKNRVFLLTNFDEVSFKLLAGHPLYHYFLKLFDGIIVSGIVHTIKPERTIFDILLTTYSIDPTTQPTLYIDDNIQNIEAMQAFYPNVSCFHVVTNTHRTIHKYLVDHAMI